MPDGLDRARDDVGRRLDRSLGGAGGRPDELVALALPLEHLQGADLGHADRQEVAAGDLELPEVRVDGEVGQEPFRRHRLVHAVARTPEQRGRGQLGRLQDRLRLVGGLGIGGREGTGGELQHQPDPGDDRDDSPLHVLRHEDPSRAREAPVAPEYRFLPIHTGK